MPRVFSAAQPHEVTIECFLRCFSDPPRFSTGAVTSRPPSFSSRVQIQRCRPAKSGVTRTENRGAWLFRLGDDLRNDERELFRRALVLEPKEATPRPLVRIV